MNQAFAFPAIRTHCFRRNRYGRSETRLATRDITAEGPVEIPGQAHARVSVGILDPLTATALAVDDGNDCVIFVSIDAGKVNDNIRDGIREKLRERRPDIPAGKMLANGTHIHTGPCTHPL